MKSYLLMVTFISSVIRVKEMFAYANTLTFVPYDFLYSFIVLGFMLRSLISL